MGRGERGGGAGRFRRSRTRKIAGWNISSSSSRSISPPSRARPLATPRAKTSRRSRTTRTPSSAASARASPPGTRERRTALPPLATRRRTASRSSAAPLGSFHRSKRRQGGVERRQGWS
eukprot:31228-Pelagococcus_subviridis.AAC.3